MTVVFVPVQTGPTYIKKTDLNTFVEKRKKLLIIGGWIMTIIGLLWGVFIHWAVSSTSMYQELNTAEKLIYSSGFLVIAAGIVYHWMGIIPKIKEAFENLNARTSNNKPEDMIDASKEVTMQFNRPFISVFIVILLSGALFFIPVFIAAGR